MAGHYFDRDHSAGEQTSRGLPRGKRGNVVGMLALGQTLVVGGGLGTDWPRLLVTLVAALLGAAVGGGLSYLATSRSMQHETKLHRADQLRDVRAEMVSLLTQPLFGANRNEPGHTIWDQLIVVERLSYSATSDEQTLAENARRTAQSLALAEGDRDDNRGPMDPTSEICTTPPTGYP